MVDLPQDNFSQLLRDRVEKWLLDEGWSINPLPLQPGVQWAMSAADANGRIMVILQPTDRPDKLSLQASVTLSPEQLMKIKQLPGEERSAFLLDLRLDLIKANHDFNHEGDQVWTILEDCFYDGLTKDSFMTRVTHVKLGIALLQWLIQRKFK